MIRKCLDEDFEQIYLIINEASKVYRDVIPTDCWKEPYMPRSELESEIEDGVVFWGYEENYELLGIMGIQTVRDVSLIRHAYVRPADQGHGVGGKLLSHLRRLTTRPILVGTWREATWAVRFYRNHGFELVPEETKNHLLKDYWSIPDRQIETSVVLADNEWMKQHR